MKTIFNFLGALAFGLIISVSFVEAKEYEQPQAGVPSAIIQHVCIKSEATTSEQAEACVKNVVSLLRYAKAVGRSERYCAVIDYNEINKQDYCEAFENDVDTQDLYYWLDTTPVNF